MDVSPQEDRLLERRLLMGSGPPRPPGFGLSFQTGPVLSHPVSGSPQWLLGLDSVFWEGTCLGAGKFQITTEFWPLNCSGQLGPACLPRREVQVGAGGGVLGSDSSALPAHQPRPPA